MPFKDITIRKGPKTLLKRGSTEVGARSSSEPSAIGALYFVSGVVIQDSGRQPNTEFALRQSSPSMCNDFPRRNAARSVFEEL